MHETDTFVFFNNYSLIIELIFLIFWNRWCWFLYNDAIYLLCNCDIVVIVDIDGDKNDDDNSDDDGDDYADDDDDGGYKDDDDDYDIIAFFMVNCIIIIVVIIIILRWSWTYLIILLITLVMTMAENIHILIVEVTAQTTVSTLLPPTPPLPHPLCSLLILWNWLRSRISNELNTEQKTFV